MANIITMPRLSDTMTEGKVSKWHKKVGDVVKEGDLLAEIETDKAVQDFESEFSGTLLYVGVGEGESTQVDQILAIIGVAGEDISSLVNGGQTSPKVEQKIDEPKNVVSEPAPKSTSEIPQGVQVITMPRLSDTMTEGKVAKWYKNIGDAVKEGDLLAEIETDKAVQEFESEFSGSLLHIGVNEGEMAKVDAVLAVIGPQGASLDFLQNFSLPSTTEEKASTQQKVAATPTEKPQVAETATSTLTTNRIFASPLAKKLAKEKGIDLSAISGTGENGRIVKRDIENYTPQITISTAPATSFVPTVSGVDSETPNSQIRTLIAKRLTESKNTAPHYYLGIEVMMDELITARAQMNTLSETKISFNDIIIKATALALRKHPQVNSSWAGDKIIHFGNIHIGVAVAIPDGLVVPVLRNADQLPLSHIAVSVKDLATRARDRQLKANEMEGSTFSISNLGMFGIESFTSIINPPNACILSVGAIIEKPVVKDKQIVVGNTMKLTLACDHRVVDGATGAAFLQTLKQLLESPLMMLI